MTPSQRTASWLKEHGFTVGTVERHISPKSFVGPGHKRDLFGCIDLIAARPGLCLAVQSTGTDWSGHWRKIMEGTGRDGALIWLATGCPMMLIGWRQLRAGWQPRIHWYTAADFLLGCPMNRERSEEDWAAGIR